MALPQNQKPANSKPQTSGQGSTVNMIVSRMNDLNTRLRLTEERINHNKERLRVYDDQMLDNKKELSKEVENLGEDIIELRKNIKNLNDTIHHIIKELELTAKKQDINVIEKYVDMMVPTRYVTKEELKLLLKKKVK